MADMTLFSQRDPRWKDTQLGFSTMTLGMYGCMLTSVTMVADCYGFNETPGTLNDKMKASGGFQGGLLVPYAITKALPGMVYNNFINNSNGNQPAPLTEIDASLAAGKPVVVEVDYSPSPGIITHWIVLYAKTGNDYLIHDPYPYPPETNPVTLTQRYGFAGDPSKIILAALWLSGPFAPAPVTPTPAPVPAPAPAPAPAPSNTPAVTASFPVYATADALAIRSQPLVADNTLIERVAMNTQFTPLETDDATNAKLGVVNQWLNARAADGTSGYVAAWYLSKTQTDPNAANNVPPERKISTQPLVVKTTGDALALRSQPVISDATLIKRLPVNTQLQVIEPADQAQAKIGVNGQWLNVQDVTGAAGYVAAWFVVVVDGQTALAVLAKPGPSSFGLTMEAPAPGPLVVRTGVENLALRRRPLIHKKTLIKRMPIDSDLLVLEPREAALAKLGQAGQWLHVRDVTGQKGYAAAWQTVRQPEPSVNEEQEMPG